MLSNITMTYKHSHFLLLLIGLALNDLCNGGNGPCYGPGTFCYNAPESCCPGLICNKKIYSCTPQHFTTTTSHPSCQKLHQQCYDASESCCPGLTCNEKSYTCTHQHFTTTTSHPSCQTLHQQCHNKACCTDLFCNKIRLPWKCEKIAQPTTIRTTTTDSPPSCQTEHKKCSYREECCSGLTCSRGHCKIITPTTTTISPKHCLGRGDQCWWSSSCCSGTCSWALTCD